MQLVKTQRDREQIITDKKMCFPGVVAEGSDTSQYTLYTYTYTLSTYPSLDARAWERGLGVIGSNLP